MCMLAKTCTKECAWECTPCFDHASKKLQGAWLCMLRLPLGGATLILLAVTSGQPTMGKRKNEEQKPKEQRPKASENKPVMTE
ncbi:hypothetical protein M5K25_002160 [Dendrobium thyrsiflorum]|uniref:Uncharacterized protein n=1 Tax=Dendrobium thyrsiflorum TaxID=117978 RepID=A0ABD0VTQ1_DENTH